MSMLQNAVDRVVKESGRQDEAFAAGVEAAAVWVLLQGSEADVLDECKSILRLRSSNRDVYRSFAEANNYKFVSIRDLEPGYDQWRFMKRA